VAGQLALTALPHPLQLTLNWQQQQPAGESRKFEVAAQGDRLR
jgi:hypothetical protein